MSATSNGMGCSSIFEIICLTWDHTNFNYHLIRIQTTIINLSSAVKSPEDDDVQHARRKLSILTDKTLVESLDNVNLDTKEEEEAAAAVMSTLLRNLDLIDLIPNGRTVNIICIISDINRKYLWLYRQFLWRLFEERIRSLQP